MKSVFIYNGSRCKESRSHQVIDKVINNINHNYNEVIEFNYYNPISHSIKNCEGCSNCFINGKCSLDEIDDMKKIKLDMIKADMVIFMTPVYAHNVSGDMKIFLDRISYWLHYMRLFNKKGIILVSNANNGGEIVIEYLTKIMSHLGISIIAAYENDMINEITEDDIVSMSNKITSEIVTPIRSNKVLEALYKSKAYPCIYPKGTHQYDFMDINGFFKSKSFKDLLNT